MAIERQIKLTNAVERFCRENPDVLYSKEDAAWFKFNGKHWEDATDEFEEITLKIWEEGELMYLGHLTNLRNLCRVKNRMLGPLNFESQMLLNTPNGVIDFNKFLELRKSGASHKESLCEWIRPHDEFKENRLTNITSASYVPNSLPPEKFLAFVTDLLQNNAEYVGYLMRFLAYCLTGAITQQFFHILYGIGRNGKSTLLTILEKVFGTYFFTISNDVIAKNRDRDTVRRILYRNRHKTVILFNELDEKFFLNLPMLKMLTGDDYIPVRIGKREKEFKGHFKLLLNTNHIPAVGSIENRGIWDRIRVLITRPPIPEDQRIDEYFKQIASEKDQILSYLIDTHFADAMTGGLKKQPQIMLQTKMYKEFDENSVEFFFDRTCRLAYHPLNKTQYVQARYLYGQYCQFHLLSSKTFGIILKIREETESRKILIPPVSETRFARQMERLGALRIKDCNMYYTNIFFSSERVYSELGERVEPKDLADSKKDFSDRYEHLYVQKRRLDESTTPYFQMMAMAKMPSETENHFEEPKPVRTLEIDGFRIESS